MIRLLIAVVVPLAVASCTHPAPPAVAPVAPIGAAPAAASAAPACYPDGAPAHVMPAFATTGDDHVCDLPDRIIVVDANQVSVLARPTLAATRAPITHTDHLGDRCDGPGGGHAGCSIKFDRFSSPALGAKSVEFGNNAGNVVEDDSGATEDCRETSPNDVIATCSTAGHFVLVKLVGDDRTAGCWRVQATVWDGAATRGRVLWGDVDRAASIAGTWRFAFGDVALRFAGAREATLEVGGTREPCAAFRLRAY